MSQEQSIIPKKQFEEIFSSNYQLFLNLGFKISNDREFTKDVIQSFFLDLWEKGINQENIKNLKAYLYKSFYRKMIYEFKRKEKNNHQRLDNQSDILIPSYEELLIESQKEAEFQTNLNKALDHLPIKQREVLTLRFQKGMDYDEIASSTGKSRQTIYNQIHSSINKLRKLLLSISIL